MMFLQYAILGVWGVTLPTFLMAPPHEGGLSLSGQQVGLLFATFAIAAMGTPFVVGLLADRWFASQRLYAVLHLLGAVVLVFVFSAVLDARSEMRSLIIRECEQTNLKAHVYQDYFKKYFPEQRLDVSAFIQDIRDGIADVLTPDHSGADLSRRQYRQLRDQWQRLDLESDVFPILDRVILTAAFRDRIDRSFRHMVVLFLVYAVCYMPSLTLSNAISFRNLPHTMRQYGHVRVFGTIGWLASGVFVGMMLPSVSALPLLYGAAGSVLLSLYAFTLPHTPPAHAGKSLAELFGVPAIKMFAQRSFRVFVITSFVITLVTAFHNTYLNRYLVDLGVKHAASWQTTGQLTEIVCILALPWMRMRIGLKRTLFIGLAASAIRFAIYAVGSVPWLIAVGIPLQGVCFGFYFVAAMLFIDRHAPRDLRASAQGLLAICTSGVGAFAGNWIAGIAVDGYRGPNGVAWPAVWALPAIGSLLAAAYFALQFREPVIESTPVLLLA